MKLAYLSLAAILAASTAHAGPFGLPDHQRDGYRDTGCDEAANVDKGGYLNNPTCPMPSGAGFPAELAGIVADALTPAPVTDPEDGGDDPVDVVDPADPVDPIDVVDPIDPPAPGCLNSGGDCNNGHGNDADGHDEGNPGKSK